MVMKFEKSVQKGEGDYHGGKNLWKE